MKALFKELPGPGGMVLRETDEPVVKKGQIKIKIHAAGICGTDLHIMKDEYPYNYPVVMGHEYSGIVEDTGEGVSGFKKGDRVVSMPPVVTCGECSHCRQGLPMLCEKRLSIGSGINGAFAQYMVVPAHTAFTLPQSVSLDEAALCEPLACVVRAATETAAVKAGDYVLVSGPGTIGLLVLQVAVASGAKVIVAGTYADKERLNLALKLGAHAIMTADKEDIERRTVEHTNGCGFDIAFECAGVSASAGTCIRLLKKTGHFAQVGLYGKMAEVDLDMLLKKEITLSSSFGTRRSSWERALRLLEHRDLNVTPLISAKLSLEEWERGFEMALNRECFKVLLAPNS